MANTPAPTPAAGTEHPAGGHKVGFPPFQAETFASQLFWLAIAFVLLYALMSKVALPRIGAVIDNRRSHMEKDIDEASAMRRQADEAGAAYDRMVGSARAQAQALGQETHGKLAADADARRHTLEAELNAKLAAAEAQIAAIRAKAMGNVDAIARDAAAEIVQRITGRAADPAAIAQAVAAPKAG